MGIGAREKGKRGKIKEESFSLFMPAVPALLVTHTHIETHTRTDSDLIAYDRGLVQGKGD